VPFAVAGTPLTAAQLSNQVRLRVRENVVAYYDAWLKTDDDIPLRTRDVHLRSQVSVDYRLVASLQLNEVPMWGS
jgi:hypothetical protein